MNIEDIKVGHTYEGQWLICDGTGLQHREVVRMIHADYGIDVGYLWQTPAGDIRGFVGLGTFAAGAIRDVTEE